MDGLRCRIAVPMFAVSSAFFAAGFVPGCAIPPAPPPVAPPPSSQPPCSATTPFTIAPTSSDAFSYLVPLGNLNPPHTLPTDHIYYIFNRASMSDPVPIEAVNAPGAIVITNIQQNFVTQNGTPISSDYRLTFSPQSCNSVNAYFDHITSLSPDLQSFAPGSADCTSSNPTPTMQITSCSAQTSVPLVPGAAIGNAGGKTSSGFDFGATDFGGPSLPFANPSRYMSDLHTICPVDLFVPAVRDALMARFGGPNGVQRTQDPVCGTTMQDKPGTAQGNWFIGNTRAIGPNSSSQSLALVHDNVDPTQGAFSVGGTVVPTGYVFNFSPHPSGYSDRDFADVTADGYIYCYTVTNPRGGFGPGGTAGDNGRFLVQLTDSTSLTVEHQNGDCSSGPLVFSNPTKYTR